MKKQFFDYIIPLIETLKELGGSGRPSEVIEMIAANQRPNEKMYEQLQNGQTRLANQIHWSRLYLVKTGYIDSSQRGIWSLTEKGLYSSLTSQEVLELVREVRRQSPNNENLGTTEDELAQTDTQVSVQPIEDHRTQLITLLKNLPPSGFERLCQRILRESGFEKVEVTGRSNDGGIDGKGILRINPLVSFSVSFQCKRYSGSVGSSVIRDFRGSIMGRADKGIILTTGSFTAEASKEATRDGAIPIELVDSEKLLSMLEQLELGVKTKTVVVYEVDHLFFEEFAIP
jgi:restriction system protein